MNNNVKLLIMFVVIVGVFYLYTLLGPKGTVTEEPIDTTAVVEEVVETPPVQTEIISDKLQPDVLESADPTMIDFSTEQFTGSIALHAGSVNSLILNKHKSHRDSILNLVPENGSFMKMTLVSGNGNIDLSGINFHIEYAGNVNPVSGTDSIVLTAKIDKSYIKRIYVFSDTSYTFTHRVEIYALIISIMISHTACSCLNQMKRMTSVILQSAHSQTAI